MLVVLFFALGLLPYTNLVACDKALTSLADSLKASKEAGYFEVISETESKRVLSNYQAYIDGNSKTSSDAFLKEVDSIRPLAMKDVDFSLVELMENGKYANFVEKAYREFSQIGSKNLADKVALKIVQDNGYKGFSPLSILKSAAGLASRFHGIVKAEGPYNYTEILSKKDIDDLLHVDKILTASKKIEKDYDKVLEIANETGGENVSPEKRLAMAIKIVKKNQKRFDVLIKKAMDHPDSVNILVPFLAGLAVESMKSGLYIHADLWTSGKTHQVVKNAIEKFKRKYKNIKYSKDNNDNQKIVDALSRYFKVSELLGETHVFGYQEEMHALNENEATFMTDTVKIGRGAGAWSDFYKNSGRRGQLSNRGVKHVQFQNIEIFTLAVPYYMAFYKTGKMFATGMVEVKDGQSGGFGFIGTKNGKKLVRLLEDSSIPKDQEDELLNGHVLYNSNTIMIPLDQNLDQNEGYEGKKQSNGKFGTRTKQNVQNAFFLEVDGKDVEVAVIEIHYGLNYKDYKSITQTIADGSEYILLSFKQIADILK